MSRSRNGLLVIVAVLVLSGILTLIYRSATSEELPDDEWIDFEHPG